MKISVVFSLLILFIALLVANNTDNKEIMITNLEIAEKTKNLRMIADIFTDDASLVYTDSPPKYGKEAIASFYEYLWGNTPIETVEYKNIKVVKLETQQIETGTFVLLNVNKEEAELPFKAIFLMEEDQYKLQLLTLGEGVTLDNKTPKLLKPTGKYKVGQSTHYYPKGEQENNRTIAFQIWYPANPIMIETAIYHSKAVARASAEFLRLPIFFNSYAPLVKTNSYKNAQINSDRKYPILLYNHGYGGFSSVYQSVFEDLASHGYIVVSIAHENESSLFITENEDVIANNPENEIFKKRAAELNGSEINKLQDIILNSDNIDENREAYLDLIKLSPLHNESTRLWITDTKSVIEKLQKLDKENPIFKGSFDFENIGIFGHSVGGAVAGQMAYDCAEIDAGINLDGFQFGDLVHNKLEIPFMFVSSNQRGSSYLRANSFMQNSQSACYQAFIKGFSHSSFTDLRLFEPGGEEAISLQRELILIFFNKYLKSQNINMNEVVDKYPIIEITKKNIN